MKKVLIFLLLFTSFTSKIRANNEESALIRNFNKKLFEEIPHVGEHAKAVQAAKNIKLLLQRGANPNAQQNGKTAVMYLIENTNNPRETVRMLRKFFLNTKYNKDIDFTADNGMTALTFAASVGSQDAILSLLAKGADANKKDDYKMTYTDYIDENQKYMYRGGYKDLEKIRNERRIKHAREKYKEELEEFEEIAIPEGEKEPLEEEWIMIDGDGK